MFKFNIDQLLANYEIMNSGQVLRNGTPATEEADYIAINSYVTNLISSGRTLTKSMECYIKENYEENDLARKEFFGFYHSNYDDSFAYRFLIRLRDFSQHGHLPVSMNGSWFGFDLQQILHKPHFRHNALLEQQIEKAAKDITGIFGDVPRLSLALTLAEFTARLFSLYSFFWNSVEEKLIESSEQFSSLIEAKPENIYSNGHFRWFVYEVIDGIAQATDAEDASIPMLEKNKNEANIISEEYTNSWNALKESMLVIRKEDNHIEIALGLDC